MTWIKKKDRTLVEWAAIKILSVGPIPKHIAFIMDGNRRYAKLQHKEALDGHSAGFEKLAEVLSWCRDLKITEVTVYAFSIENFKRTKSEVSGLIALAEEKFALLLKEMDSLIEHGVCIKVIGRTDLLTPKLRCLIAKAVLSTQHLDKCCLTLALAYTSRQEIGNSMNEMKRGVDNGQLKLNDLSENLLENCLYTAGTRDPDLLIRTSGETRLSDFILWQSSFTHLFFTKVLWPQISIWHLFAAIFQYQRHHHSLLELKTLDSDRRISKEEEWDSKDWISRGGYGNFPSLVNERKERINSFLKDLYQRRQNSLIEESNLILV